MEGAVSPPPACERPKGHSVGSCAGWREMRALCQALSLSHTRRGSAGACARTMAHFGVVHTLMSLPYASSKGELPRLSVFRDEFFGRLAPVWEFWPAPTSRPTPGGEEARGGTGGARLLNRCFEKSISSSVKCKDREGEKHGCQGGMREHSWLTWSAFTLLSTMKV